MEIATQSGRTTGATFRPRLDTVEVWHEQHCSAVFDRKVLRAWLTLPSGLLAVDEVRLVHDGGVDSQIRIVMSLPVVGAGSAFAARARHPPGVGVNRDGTRLVAQGT
jgi:hypothetical protein